MEKDIYNIHLQTNDSKKFSGQIARTYFLIPIYRNLKKNKIINLKDKTSTRIRRKKLGYEISFTAFPLNPALSKFKRAKYSNWRTNSVQILNSPLLPP